MVAPAIQRSAIRIQSLANFNLEHVLLNDEKKKINKAVNVCSHSRIKSLGIPYSFTMLVLALTMYYLGKSLLILSKKIKGQLVNLDKII